MKLVQSFTRGVNRSLLQTKKQSPHIFFAVGVVGVITSTVLACRATLKLHDTLDDIQKDVDSVKEMKRSEHEIGERHIYAVDEYGRDAAYVYVKAGFQIVKLYAPAVIVGGASIGLLTASHVELSRRNAALTAAYSVLSKAFEDYRERVREEIGEDKEQELYRGIRTEVEAGTQVKSINPDHMSAYAVLFNESSANWTKDAELNRIFLTANQNHANQMLLARGHVFLNEIYDMLDIPRSSWGSVVGWVHNQDRDSHIDFGMWEDRAERFMNGEERSVWLDFNVDGIIYDKI
jgi:Family of unknown function (DUF6353)